MLPSVIASRQPDRQGFSRWASSGANTILHMLQVLRLPSTSTASLQETTAGTPLAWERTPRGSTGNYL